MRQLGFLACLWRYGWAERTPMKLPALLPKLPELTSERPDLLVVQSESFFDPRSLYPGIRPEVLAEFDRLNSEALSHGRLNVPAWGANTVRSEFAFLSGATEAMLGVHRFNPYRQILKAEFQTLATALKAVGYRTVCVHPYPASFYGRDKVYPHLGFDEFVDIRSFIDAPRSGPYIADQALAEHVKALIGSAERPIFVFVITMENHGPLHLEKPSLADKAAAYTDNQPAYCDDLTVYLRHLKNADRMIGNFRHFLKLHRRPARLCWYGDHVPIMADVYRQLGDPDGLTEYCIWSNVTAANGPEQNIQLVTLAKRLLQTMP
jgi:phosphoglycerol transferase MdoB-like AlkP superfamily enzyme